MATLEEVLAALNGATTNAREVLTKIPQIATTNGDVTFTFADGTQILIPGLPKLKSQVDGFIAGARGEYPALNFISNVALLDNNGNGVPDGFVFQVGNPGNNPPSTASITNSELLPLSEFQEEIIQDLGWASWMGVFSFNVLKVTITNGENSTYFGLQASGIPPTVRQGTMGAVVKITNLSALEKFGCGGANAYGTYPNLLSQLESNKWQIINGYNFPEYYGWSAVVTGLISPNSETTIYICCPFVVPGKLENIEIITR